MTTLLTRTYFSQHHIEAAAFFARQAWQIELANAKSRPSFSPEHRGCVVAAVFLSTASLEAAINELFSDALEGHYLHLSGLDPEAIALFARMWKHGIPRTAQYSILGKYAVALALAAKPPMNKGTDPWRAANALVKLRNALVHYEPEWISADSTRKPNEVHRKTKLLSGLFPTNPLTSTGNPFYPDKVLGHGCAAWAVKTVTLFTDKFATILGITPPFEGIRSQLDTDQATHP